MDEIKNNRFKDLLKILEEYKKAKRRFDMVIPIIEAEVNKLSQELFEKQFE